MSDTVAVLLPLFNGRELFQEAVRSVQCQTYEHWRLFIVDDCSQDDSLALATKVAAMDHRIQVIASSENLGLYGQLNRAVALIDCRWTVILMQDDLLLPSHLLSFVELAQRYPRAPIFWAEVATINVDGTRLSNGRTTERVEPIEPSIAAWHSVLKRGCIWTISGSFSLTSFLKAHPFQPDLPHAADLKFILTVVKTEQSVYLERTLTQIRLHGGQATNRHARRSKDLVEYVGVLRDERRTDRRALSAMQWIRLEILYQFRFVRRALRRFMLRDWRAGLGALIALQRQWRL